MERTALASVVTGPNQCEVRELPVSPLGDDGAWLKVEAAGVCGSDVRFYASRGQERILGHENVGVIADISVRAARRWGLSEGDQVVVEEYLPCGHCRFCRGRDFRLCDECDPFMHDEPMRFGATPLVSPPGLWGGYSQYLYLDSRTVLHKVVKTAPWRELAMALPIGNGFEWAYFVGQVGPGQTMVVLGPGQQGLGCVLAGKICGASKIIVFGLERDRHRLAVAEALGADVVSTETGGGAVDVVRAVTGGDMADLVIDTAAGSSETVTTGIAMLRKLGRFLTPTAQAEGIDHLPLRTLTAKCIALRGVRGHSYDAVEMAIEAITAGQFPLDRMASHAFGLEEVDVALRRMSGEGPQDGIHFSICPWAEQPSPGAAQSRPVGLA